MPYIDHLYYEARGSGEAVVFVHGSWSDHTTWRLVVDQMPDSLRTITYDRRGYSRSKRPRGVLPRSAHESDLAGLIEALDIGPAHVVGNSYGASIAIAVAARRPEVVRSVVAHEPQLTAIVDHDSAERAAIAQAEAAFHDAMRRIERGDSRGAAEQFVEEVALGPGMWALLPEQIRQIMVANAATVYDEQLDPDWLSIGLDELEGTQAPVLLTYGDLSPSWFYGVIAKVGENVPEAELQLIPGAGHAPHASHPLEFADAVAGFLGRVTAPV